MFHRLIDRWRQSIVLHNNNDKDNDNDNIGGTTDLQFRPTGETLSIPLRNSMKVPRLTGTSTAASSRSVKLMNRFRFSSPCYRTSYQSVRARGEAPRLLRE